LEKNANSLFFKKWLCFGVVVGIAVHHARGSTFKAGSRDFKVTEQMSYLNGCKALHNFFVVMKFIAARCDVTSLVVCHSLLCYVTEFWWTWHCSHNANRIGFWPRQVFWSILS
jgi:hypothetical protein